MECFFNFLTVYLNLSTVSLLKCCFRLYTVARVGIFQGKKPYHLTVMSEMSDNSQLIRNFTELLGSDRVLTDPADRIVYECDGLVLNKRMPDVVVLPETTEEVAAIVKICNRHEVPYLARGAGTGLSGGAVAHNGGVILQMSLMNRILEINYDDELAVVQPGVVNIQLSDQTTEAGYHFAPDPSSQKACTIGGNVAENAGGPHTLKYGVTTDHVLGLTAVLPNGSVETFGGRCEDIPGYDLIGLMVGSEGTLGIATEITVKLTRNPQMVQTFLAVYDSIEAASQTITRIISAGIVPAALELIDSLVIEAVESHMKLGFPTDAEAILLIEIDGAPLQLSSETKRIQVICQENGAREFRHAQNEQERQDLWRGRKESIGALGKVTQAFYTNDGVVPRSKLPEIIRRDMEIGKKHGLRVAHVCHAGDGNIHPIILYNPDDDQEIKAALAVSEEILKTCVDLGGSLTGEHGIGTEKRETFSLMFSNDDQQQMMKVRIVFNPQNLLNPGKIFPTGARCGEAKIKKTISRGGWL